MGSYVVVVVVVVVFVVDVDVIVEDVVRADDQQTFFSFCNQCRKERKSGQCTDQCFCLQSMQRERKAEDLQTVFLCSAAVQGMNIKGLTKN